MLHLHSVVTRAVSHLHLQQFCQAIGEATQEHFALATLSSDTNGTAQFTSFLGAITSMKGLIVAAAPVFVGSKWPDFAEAIAFGICTEIGNNGIGSLSGAVTPGSGSGVVTII